MDYWKTALLALAALPALAGEPVLTCEPRELRGVPGEPLRAEVTVETDRATPIQLCIPAVSNLVVYTVEKVPIRRTAAGRYIQKRQIVWQGTEPGSVLLTNLTVTTATGGTDFQGLENVSENLPNLGNNESGQTLLVPHLGITIDPVEPAEPPEASPAQEEAK
jgi:hypothetical protein